MINFGIPGSTLWSTTTPATPPTCGRSVETYLQHFGDVRGAAAELQIHPNTLRYRIRRAEDILDINLGEPAGRLLVELQLAVLRRSMMINQAE